MVIHIGVIEITGWSLYNKCNRMEHIHAEDRR